jgi:hypothetical protein
MAWNCDRLRGALVPLTGYGAYAQTARTFSIVYERAYMTRMGYKLGLVGLCADDPSDAALVNSVSDVDAYHVYIACHVKACAFCLVFDDNRYLASRVFIASFSG